ncbi:MAG: tetratricopeptide repeat protein [bacterium]
MKYSAVITVLALLLLAFVIARQGGTDREFTTTSDEAYAAYKAGNEALHSFQYGKAIAALQHAIELDPDFAMARVAYAIALQHTNRKLSSVNAQQADSLAQLLSDENERLLVQLRLAKFHLVKDINRDSILTLLEARIPQHEIVLSTKAYIATQETAENEKAQKLWLELLEVNPNYARAYNWLGYNASYMSRYDEALAYLNKYAFLAPELANPHDSIGDILMQIGKYEAAEKELKKALEIQPDFFVSLMNLARIYMAQGMIKKGVNILEKLRGEIAGTGYERDIDGILISTFYQYDLKDKLTQALETYCERYASEEDSHYYYAYLMLCHGDVDSSLAVAASFLAKAAEMTDLADNELARQRLARLEHSHRAAVAMSQQDYATAVDEWQLVLANSRGVQLYKQFGSLARYAQSLIAMEQYEEALAQANLILSINPRQIPALLAKIEAQMGLEQWEEANTTLKQAVTALNRADNDFPALARADSLYQELVSRPRS